MGNVMDDMTGQDEQIPHSYSPKSFSGPIMAQKILSPRRVHTRTLGMRELAQSLEQLLAWSDLAACKGSDPGVFFPVRGTNSRQAKAVCAGCVVREECLEWALTTNERFGVWGGMSERERRRERRRRGLFVPQPAGLDRTGSKHIEDVKTA